MMFLSLDNLANRYGLLPSEVLSRATTLDLYVLDLSAKYQRYRDEKAQGLNPPTRKPSQEELKAMLTRVKANKQQGA